MSYETLNRAIQNALKLIDGAAALADARASNLSELKGRIPPLKQASEAAAARHKATTASVQTLMNLLVLPAHYGVADALADARAQERAASQAWSAALRALSDAECAVNRIVIPISKFRRLRSDLARLRSNFSQPVPCLAAVTRDDLVSSHAAVTEVIFSWYPRIAAIAPKNVEIAKLEADERQVQEVLNTGASVGKQALLDNIQRALSEARSARATLEAEAKEDFEAVAPFVKLNQALIALEFELGKFSHFVCNCLDCSRKRYQPRMPFIGSA
jgi:hypothetical protein